MLWTLQFLPHGSAVSGQGKGGSKRIWVSALQDSAGQEIGPHLTEIMFHWYICCSNSILKAWLHFTSLPLISQGLRAESVWISVSYFPYFLGVTHFCTCTIQVSLWLFIPVSTCTKVPRQNAMPTAPICFPIVHSRKSFVLYLLLPIHSWGKMCCFLFIPVFIHLFILSITLYGWLIIFHLEDHLQYPLQTQGENSCKCTEMKFI